MNANQRAHVISIITDVLESTREVNGGELESILTIYTPEGIAVLITNALSDQGVLA